MDESDQKQLVIGSTGWLEVYVMHIVHRIDIEDRCLVPLGKNQQRIHLSELELDQNFVNGLLSLAKSFQKLQLDNSQLALLSAISLFQPDHLPLNESIKSTYEKLWKVLRFQLEQSPNYESPDRVRRWPMLHVQLIQLQRFLKQYDTIFFDKNDARELAKLFS